MKYSRQLDSMPIRIVSAYTITTVLWIIFSELLLHHLIKNVILLDYATMLKGALFVAVTSGMLYLQLRCHVTRVNQNMSQLLENEARYSTLMENARDGIFIQTKGLFAYLNASACGLFGAASPEELIGKPVVERYHPDYHDKVLDRIRVINNERRPVSTTDEKCLRMDGSLFDVDLQAVPFEYEGENGALVFFRDISQHKQAEREMEKGREFLAAILDCIEDGVVACDQDGALTLLNRASRRIHGIPEGPLRPEELVEHCDLFEADGKTRMSMEDVPLFCALQGIDVTNREMVVKPKGAKPVNLLVTGRQLIDRKENKLGAVVSLQDITAIKKLEEHLRQSQKMDSIGTLAGGVAHDFNNILTVIIGACTLLTMKTKSDPELEPFVRQIMDSSERAAKLTRSLLAFSRKQNIRLLPADVNEIVLSIKEFLGRIIGEDVNLVAVPNPFPLSVSVDRGQVEQVLMNLAANARDAMPNGGELRIELKMVDTNRISLDLDGCPNGLYAQIDVIDTGYGMDMATMSRIFEPFFTTKELGRGTGLGLSMAYGIVKQHEGVIKVSSEPGRGTTFSIYLPIRTISHDDDKKKAEVSFPTGNEKILLVEDDDDVRVINGNILKKVGYKVVAASNGEEAVRLFEQHLDTISLVVLDVIMPGMNGRELYDRLKLIHPQVKMLFASGYSAEHLQTKGVVPDGVNFLSKPFVTHVFLNKVRDLIDS